MNPTQQREKVLRDALEYMQRVWMTYWGRPAPVITDALAAADAIPDAPVVTKVIYPNTPTCPTCKTWFSSLCSDGYHAPIPAAPLPHAPVIADGRQVGTLVTAQRVDLRESPPVPSRAELIKLIRETFLGGHEETLTECMARILDALIKAGAVK